MNDHYSALDKADLAMGYKPTEFVAFPRSSLARVWDLEREGRLPAEFSHARCLFAEPPWRNGYEAFNRRAGVTGRGFNELMAVLAKVVTSWTADGKPAVVICGRAMVKMLPDPDVPVIAPRLDYQRHASPWVALCWGFVPPALTVDLVPWLADRYRMIGDPFCGFGNAGRIAAQRGGGFILSDVNPRCVGYIAAHGRDWFS